MVARGATEDPPPNDYERRAWKRAGCRKVSNSLCKFAGSSPEALNPVAVRLG